VGPVVAAGEPAPSPLPADEAGAEGVPVAEPSLDAIGAEEGTPAGEAEAVDVVTVTAAGDVLAVAVLPAGTTSRSRTAMVL
jgi:hypothetical protein